MTSQEFIAKWGRGGPAFDLNEEQGAQSYFLELCELLDVPRPGSSFDYHFEEKSALIGGRVGYADVFKRGCFAWENKAPGKNLDTALKQLLTYSLALSNPPLLVVCDRLITRIHTQFNGHPSEVYTVLLSELDQPEKRALLRRLWLEPESFRPRQGIELNAYAAELARLTVWIGELQWRMAHGFEFKTNPVLAPLDQIECRDALLTEGTEARWPKVDVVMGNPPFLGGSKKRRELGDAYFDTLATVFNDRVPAGADLVCYWFERARGEMQAGRLQAAGLVATQAIRAGANRTVLDHLLAKPISVHNSPHEHDHFRHTAIGGATALGGHIAGASGGGGKSHRQELGQSGDGGLLRSQAGISTGSTAHRSGSAQVDDGRGSRRGHVLGVQSLPLIPTPLSIFNAWADEPCVNEGAAVRVSLVCFGVGEQGAQLNGQPVPRIHADLTGGVGLDLTAAKALDENAGASYKGAEKNGDFDIPGSTARGWLALPNPNGKSNFVVLKPWKNGQNAAGRPSDVWVVDFGVELCVEDASLFETPFAYVETNVKPERERKNVITVKPTENTGGGLVSHDPQCALHWPIYFCDGCWR